MKSKALKDFPDRVERWYDSIKDALWDLKWNVSRPFRALKKLYDWQKAVFDRDFDFDSHGMYRMLQYKLIRLEKVLKNGHAIQEPKDMKALKLAIKLLGRLDEDDHMDPAYKRHERKWGLNIHWTEKLPNEDMYAYKTWRTNMLPSQRDEERDDYRKNILDVGYRQKERDKRWLYGILAKYSEAWWD